MALDFHISKTQKEAPYKNASASLSVETHNAIFSGSKNHVQGLRSLQRISDYYSDAKYDLIELERFLQELEKLKQNYSSKSTVYIELERIQNACLQAIVEKSSIWVYCD